MPKAEIKRREIGAVVIFDLFGPLTEKSGETIRDELETDIQKGNYINVILNTQGVEASDELTLRKILVTMERPVRKAIYCDNDAFFKALSETYLSDSVPVCRSEEEIVNLFGAYLLEKGKRIGKKDRRRYPRIKIAIPVGINLINPRGETVQTKAIVTNLSDGGIFAEYLDWRSADEVKNLGDIKNMNAKIIFHHPNTENQTAVQGRVIRLEENQNQVGIAVQYVKE